MPEEKVVDLRGYSCPQPQLMSYSELTRLQSGTIVFLVNPGNPTENVSRNATNLKWSVEKAELDGYNRLTCKK